MFNIYLGIYIVVALLVLAGGTFKFINGGLTLAGILFFIGAAAVLVVFGLKWFKANSLFSETPVSWPPTINTCPDYLVYYARNDGSGSATESCIDLIGVSKNGSLKVFPKDGPAPTSEDYYFSISTKSSDPAKRHAELCQRAIAFGLTWEGITNGESCLTPAGPVAPGSGGSSGSGGCPAS